MLKFKDFLLEGKRRSKSSISPSRQRYLEKTRGNSREDQYKSRLPEMSDDEKHEGVLSSFKPDALMKVKNSSHDPSAPIDARNPLPESVKSLGRAIVYHFEQGVVKKREALNKQYYPDKEEGFKRFQDGHKMIRVASHAMKTYLGDHYRQLLPRVETRQVLKNLFAKS